MLPNRLALPPLTIKDVGFKPIRLLISISAYFKFEIQEIINQGSLPSFVERLPQEKKYLQVCSSYIALLKVD